MNVAPAGPAPPLASEDVVEERIGGAQAWCRGSSLAGRASEPCRRAPVPVTALAGGPDAVDRAGAQSPALSEITTAGVGRT